MPLIGSTDTMTADAASREMAAMLEIASGAPVSLTHRLAVTHGGAPVEWTEEYARPDACRCVMRLVAEGPIMELVEVKSPTPLTARGARG